MGGHADFYIGFAMISIGWFMPIFLSGHHAQPMLCDSRSASALVNQVLAFSAEAPSW